MSVRIIVVLFIDWQNILEKKDKLQLPGGRVRVKVHHGYDLDSKVLRPFL